MVGVLKLTNIELSVTPGAIRRLFKENGARPEDIHLVVDGVGKHNGSAFLIFNQVDEARQGLKLNGKILKNKALNVRNSSPPEFNRIFPNVPMLTKPKGIPKSNREFRSYGGRVFPPDGNMERGRPSFESRNDYRSSRSGRGDRRDRSRSPVRRDADRRRTTRDRSNAYNNGAEMSVNKNKFLQLSAVPYDVTELDVQNFFRPILVRDVYFSRSGGKYIDVFIGFYYENDAVEAIRLNGKRFGSRPACITRPSTAELMQALQMGSGPPSEAASNFQQPNSSLPDLSGLNAVASGNPEVQHLLQLLTATVSNLAGAAVVAAGGGQQQQQPDVRETSYREPRERHFGYRAVAAQRNFRNVDRTASVVNRVASSAKVDVDDINMGRVVGIRNLPFTVTPDEILQFFRGCHAIADSVRIHYLDDGRCSGDAIISFQGKQDARRAVSTLNKRMIGRRKVELFFL